jgi:hypothetical protein
MMSAPRSRAHRASARLARLRSQRECKTSASAMGEPSGDPLDAGI